MPTVHHPSWDHLSAALRAIGVDEVELDKARRTLDEKGNYTLTEVHLEDDDLRALGFVDI